MSTAASPAPQGGIVLWGDDHRTAFIDVFGKDYLKDFQDPIAFRPCTFFNPAVQSCYRRDFALISRTLFAEYIYRRRIDYNQAVLDSFSTLCSTKAKAIRELLTRNHGRIDALLRQNNLTADAGYLKVQQKLVPIIHGSAMQYIMALELLDAVLAASGSAVLYGALDSEQRRQVEMTSRRAIKAFTAMVRNEAIKMRKEAQRLLAANRGDTSADSGELAATEAMQGKAIAKFDESLAQDNASGPSATIVTPEAATEVLAGAVAAGAAAARGGKKGASKAPDAPAT